MTNNDVAARLLYRTQGADWLMERATSAHTEAVLARVLRYIRPGDRILDVCCGYGRLTHPLLERGFDVTGIDITDALLEKGRELLRTAGILRDPFLLGNMKNLPFANGTFDFAFCVWASFNFLTTKGDQQKALEEMSRILKPGGRALIECPFHDYPAPVQTVQIGPVTYEYYPLTVGEMRAVAAESAFLESNVFTEVLDARVRMLAVLYK